MGTIAVGMWNDIGNTKLKEVNSGKEITIDSDRAKKRLGNSPSMLRKTRTSPRNAASKGLKADSGGRFAHGDTAMSQSNNIAQRNTADAHVSANNRASSHLPPRPSVPAGGGKSGKNRNVHGKRQGKSRSKTATSLEGKSGSIDRNKGKTIRDAFPPSDHIADQGAVVNDCEKTLDVDSQSANPKEVDQNANLLLALSRPPKANRPIPQTESAPLLPPTNIQSHRRLNVVSKGSSGRDLHEIVHERTDRKSNIPPDLWKHILKVNEEHHVMQNVTRGTPSFGMTPPPKSVGNTTRPPRKSGGISASVSRQAPSSSRKVSDELSFNPDAFADDYSNSDDEESSISDNISEPSSDGNGEGGGGGEDDEGDAGGGGGGDESGDGSGGGKDEDGDGSGKGSDDEDGAGSGGGKDEGGDGSGKGSDDEDDEDDDGSGQGSDDEGDEDDDGSGVGEDKDGDRSGKGSSTGSEVEEGGGSGVGEEEYCEGSSTGSPGGDDGGGSVIVVDDNEEKEEANVSGGEDDEGESSSEERDSEGDKENDSSSSSSSSSESDSHDENNVDDVSVGASKEKVGGEIVMVDLTSSSPSSGESPIKAKKSLSMRKKIELAGRKNNRLVTAEAVSDSFPRRIDKLLGSGDEDEGDHKLDEENEEEKENKWYNEDSLAGYGTQPGAAEGVAIGRGADDPSDSSSSSDDDGPRPPTLDVEDEKKPPALGTNYRSTSLQPKRLSLSSATVPKTPVNPDGSTFDLHDVDDVEHDDNGCIPRLFLVDSKDRDALSYTYVHRSLKNCSIGVPSLAGQPPSKTFDVHILPGKLRPCEVHSPALFTATPEKVFKETTKRKSKMGNPARSKKAVAEAEGKYKKAMDNRVLLGKSHMHSLPTPLIRKTCNSLFSELTYCLVSGEQFPLIRQICK